MAKTNYNVSFKSHSWNMVQNRREPSNSTLAMHTRGKARDRSNPVADLAMTMLDRGRQTPFSVRVAAI